MKSLVLVSIMTLSSFSFGQLYSYYYGYEEGYHEACGCNKKIEMTNSLLYNTGTRNDGYNAGFVDGRIYKNQNSNQQNTQELYQPDFKLIQQSLSQKQALLDQRRQMIQNEYFAIQDIFIAIVEKRNPQVLTQAEQDYFTSLKAIATKYGNYDLTDNNTFNQIMNWLSIEKAKVSKW